MKYANMSINEYINHLSSNEPMPGGGVASALVALEGVSLFLMVLNLSIGKEKYKEYEEDLLKYKKEFEQSKEDFLNLMDMDETAYNVMIEALKMKKETKEEQDLRKKKMQKAFKVCAFPPLRLLTLSCLNIAYVNNMIGKVTKSALSDIVVGIKMLKSASECSMENVFINTRYIEDEEFKKDYEFKAESMMESVNSLHDELIEKINSI